MVRCVCERLLLRRDRVTFQDYKLAGLSLQYRHHNGGEAMHSSHTTHEQRAISQLQVFGGNFTVGGPAATAHMMTGHSLSSEVTLLALMWGAGPWTLVCPMQSMPRSE